ncbi:ABC transporter ATP-binding protein uup [Arthrobacter sp. Hiyo6]|nr:ABC transporter ATP-binding protein uup [Arthrobacter sp. Hiyo6]
MMEHDDEPTQMTYAQAIVDWGDAGGYDVETVWDEVCMAALGLPFDRAQHRPASSLSGGEQKRLVLEALFAGPDELLLLDEPDNYLDVPGKRWLEAKLNESKKTVLFISHDRELLNNAAGRIVTLEPGINGAGAWVHGGGFGSYVEARADRNARFEELRKRWDEEHVKLKELVNMYKNKAAFRSDMANRYHAAQTRLDKFLEAGPPEALPIEQNVKMRLKGGRTAKRAVVAEKLELTGLMKPFSTEVWFGDRVGVLGSNGSGKSHFLRLLAQEEPIRSVSTCRCPTSRSRRSRTKARSNSAPASAPDSSPRRTSAPTCSGRPCWRSFTGATSTVPAWVVRPPPARLTDMGSPGNRNKSTSRSRAASRPGSRSCSFSSPAPRCCCWMSQRTTWTCTQPRRWNGQ